MVRMRAARTIVPAAAVAAALAAFGLAPPAGRTPIPSAVPSGAADEGAAPAAGNVSLRVYLSGQNLAGLQALAQQVSTPGSAQYGHFLTPAQYAAEFGPTAGQRAAVSGWLRGCGLDVTGATAHYV